MIVRALKGEDKWSAATYAAQALHPVFLQAKMKLPVTSFKLSREPELETS